MSLELGGRQLTLPKIDLWGTKGEKICLDGERTLIHVLTDDFVPTIQLIRDIYLPKGLLANNPHLLKEAIPVADKLRGQLDTLDIMGEEITFTLACNLEALRIRDRLLQTESNQDRLCIAHLPLSQEWEREIRLATIKQFFQYKTKSPEDKGIKTGTPWIGSTTETIWLMSLNFYPNPRANQADYIAGENWLSAQLFSYYFSFLRRKEEVFRELT